MKSEAPGFMLYLDVAQQLGALSDAQAGRVIKAICSYAATGEISPLSKIENLVFLTLQGQVDRSAEKYAAICEKNRQNIQKRWEKETDDTKPPHSLPFDIEAQRARNLEELKQLGKL